MVQVYKGHQGKLTKGVLGFEGFVPLQGLRLPLVVNGLHPGYKHVKLDDI